MKPTRFLVLAVFLSLAGTATDAAAQSTASWSEPEPTIPALHNASNAAAAPPEPSPVSLRFSVLRFRDDGGYEITVPTIGISRSIAKNVSAVASIGTGSFRALYESDKSSETRLFPIRAGLVGHSGALELELGMTVIAYRENTSCAKGTSTTWDSSEGVHGAVRIDMPVGGSRRSAFLEVGAQMLLDDNHLSPCRTRLMAQDYGGWVGLGLSF